MTTAAVISRLETLAKQTSALVESLRAAKIRPSKDQYNTLEAVSLKIVEDATNIPVEIDALKRRRAESACKEGKKLVSEAESHRDALITTGELKSRIMFCRNVTLFFEGTKESALDSASVKAWKKLTRERCEQIRGLSSDGVVSWAVAFAPSVWTANLISKNTFDYLIEDIEPEYAQTWPSEIYSVLRTLGAEEPLKSSNKYQEFLKVVEDQTRSSIPSRKRRHVNEHTEAQLAEANVQAQGLTGDVFELTVEDAQAVTASDQIDGFILLTNTFYQTPPFLTIPITRKLCNQYTRQRLQLM